MNPRIYYVGGTKGGTGKSTVSACLMDYFLRKGGEVLLIDCDRSADVAGMYKDVAPCFELQLWDRTAWQAAIKICEDHPNHIVVVNTATGDIHDVERDGGLLNSQLDSLGRELVTLWALGRDPVCVEFLARHQAVFSKSTTHVLCNSIIRSREPFRFYDASPIKAEIEAAGGITAPLPSMYLRVVPEVFFGDLAIASAAEHLSIPSKVELMRWLEEMAKVFDVVTSHDPDPKAFEQTERPRFATWLDPEPV